MRLTPDDAALYYRLMYPLQFFVNQRLKILPGLDSMDAYISLTAQQKLPVRDALYQHPELIDAFVAENPAKLSADELAIVRSWKHFVTGEFYLERYLKKYSIWIGDGSPAKVYAVLGIVDSLDEIVHPSYLPLRIKAVLLPFKGKIIYDGVFQSYNIFFGSGIKGSLREEYMAAKQYGRIIETLEPETSTQRTAPIVERDWRPQLEELAKLADKLKGTKAPIQSEAFGLIKASLRLAHAVAQNEGDLDALWKELKGAQRAIDKVETALHRATM